MEILNIEIQSEECYQMSFEQEFDIDKVSFKNVSPEFEKKFRAAYARSLSNMSGSRDPLTNSSGTNSLELLEDMARRISDYDEESRFEDSYTQLLREYEPFTET
jgi:hypothetical protein